eukprot:1160001-Pelagomonas_calceolata.AAC.6
MHTRKVSWNLSTPCISATTFCATCNAHKKGAHLASLQQHFAPPAMHTRKEHTLHHCNNILRTPANASALVACDLTAEVAYRSHCIHSRQVCSTIERDKHHVTLKTKQRRVTALDQVKAEICVLSANSAFIHNSNGGAGSGACTQKGQCAGKMAGYIRLHVEQKRAAKMANIPGNVGLAAYLWPLAGQPGPA